MHIQGIVFVSLAIACIVVYTIVAPGFAARHQIPRAVSVIAHLAVIATFVLCVLGNLGHVPDFFASPILTLALPGVYWLWADKRSKNKIES